MQLKLELVGLDYHGLIDLPDDAFDERHRSILDVELTHAICQFAANARAFQKEKTCSPISDSTS